MRWLINWLYIQNVFFWYIKNGRLTGSEILIIKTPRQICAYEAPVVSRNKASKLTASGKTVLKIAKQKRNLL